MYGQAEGTLGQRLTPTADPSDPCQQGPLIFNVLKALGNNKSNHKNEKGNSHLFMIMCSNSRFHSGIETEALI